MKKIIYEGDIVYIGSPDEIKSLYRSIIKASDKKRTNLFPSFRIDPIFDDSVPLYGLKFEKDGHFWKVGFTVIALMMYDVLS